MPFVSRDSNGNINAVSVQATMVCGESLDDDDDELRDYIRSFDVVAPPKLNNESEAALIRSDLDLVRVMEDLINVLINKNVICFTDLPYVAQQKIIKRRDIREAILQTDSLLDDDDCLIQLNPK